MGVQAFHQKKYQLAKSLLLDAIQQDSSPLENYFYLAQACIQTGAHAEAADYLNIYLHRTKDNPIEKTTDIAVANNLLGQCYETMHNHEQAKACYKMSTQLNPMAPLPWYRLGLFYAKSAQQYIDIHLAPIVWQLQQAYIQLTLMLEVTTHYPRFIKCLQICLEQHIDALQKQETLANQQVDNAFKSAIQYHYQALNACTQDEPLKATIRLHLTEVPAQYGHYLYKNQDYTNAQKYYSQALKFDPDHLVTLNQLGMCYLKKEIFLEARAYFAEIIDRANEKQMKADAWYNIAITYRLQKNWRKAANCLREAKLLAPHDTTILDEEQHLRHLVSTTFFTSTKFKTFLHSKKPVPEETETEHEYHP